MFFVLSGFLIVTLLIRERRESGAISLSKFYLRRTLRIFPPYYALLLALIVVYAVVQTNSRTQFFAALPMLGLYLTNWTTVRGPNLGIAWSLAVEEQFYLIWPAVEKYLTGTKLYVLLGAVILLNQLINFGFCDGFLAAVYGRHEPPTLEILDVTFTPIALGVLLAHVLHHPKGFAAAAKLCRGRGAASVVGAGLLVLIYIAPNDLSGWPRLFIHLGMTSWLACLVVREDHRLRWLLSHQMVSSIGAISYGMYLYHMWAYHAALAVNARLGWQSFLALFATGLSMTVIAAWLSYKFLESPIRGLKWRKTAPDSARGPRRRHCRR